MKNSTYNQSKEEGRRTWTALQNQWAEALGFFGGMFSSLIHFVKKQFWGMLLFAVVFGALGGGYIWMKKTTFHAEMTVSYAQLEKKIYGDMLLKLNQLIESKQYAAVAERLQLTEEQVKQIRDIYGENIHGEPLINDISVEKVPFYIVVDVYDVSVLPDLQNALVDYISQSDFVHQRLLLNERNYRNEIQYMKGQMVYMDSLKTMLLSDCANLDADAVVNLEKLNKSQNEFFGRIRDLEAALQFNKNIEVMDGFIAHREPFTGLLIKYILMGMFVGIGVRMLWLMFR